jgi:protocatechuate 3,4-dioxygenase beta subunit
MLLQSFFLLLAAVSVKASDSKQQCDVLWDDVLETRQNGCVLTPESVEGPYHINQLLERSDVTDGELGIPLDLTFLIRDANTCEALPNVIVDIWHCNATGFYSGFLSAGNGFGTSRGIPTDESRFLRGIQTSNANGEVKFRTIYPGWYTGRSLHIHIKLYYGVDTTTAKYTGQLYFNEEINEAVSNVLPYSTSPVTRLLNSVDQWFNDKEGNQTTLEVTGSVVAGFDATFVIGIERPETPSSASSMFSFHRIFWVLGLQVGLYSLNM